MFGFFKGKKEAKTPVQRPPGAQGPPQMPAQVEEVPAQSGGGFFDLPSTGSLGGSTPARSADPTDMFGGLNMGGASAGASMGSNSVTAGGGGMFGGLSVRSGVSSAPTKAGSVADVSVGDGTASSFGFMSTSPAEVAAGPAANTSANAAAATHDIPASGGSSFGFLGGGGGAPSTPTTTTTSSTSSTSSSSTQSVMSSSASSGFGFMGSSSTQPAADAAPTKTTMATQAETSASTPAASATGASTPVIGTMGLAPITAGKSRKKKKKGRKVGFGRDAALQEMQASEAAGVNVASATGSSTPSSGGGSMLAGMNIRKKAPTPAADALPGQPAVSEEERKFQEDLQRAMAESMKDAAQSATATTSTPTAAATQSQKPQPKPQPTALASSTPDTSSSRRPSISGTSLLPSPDELGMSITCLSSKNNFNKDSVEQPTLPSTLSAFSLSAAQYKDQVIAFGARKASLRKRKRDLEEAALELTAKVAAAESEVLSAIESEDFEKAEKCQVTMGEAKAQQSRNESELREVASSVNGLRSEQLSLFEGHMSSVSMLVEDVGSVKSALEASLRESTSVSTDHVERERRRLTLVVQKLDLEKEHLDLDAQGVKEDRLALDKERSLEKNAAEKELEELGAARLSVESDLEELRRQVAEKERELDDLNTKAEMATAVVQEVRRIHN